MHWDYTTAYIRIQITCGIALIIGWKCENHMHFTLKDDENDTTTNTVLTVIILSEMLHSTFSIEFEFKHMCSLEIELRIRKYLEKWNHGLNSYNACLHSYYVSFVHFLSGVIIEGLKDNFFSVVLWFQLTLKAIYEWNELKKKYPMTNHIYLCSVCAFSFSICS